MTPCTQLLISVVRRTRGDRVVELVRSAGATGSTIFLGRGASGNSLLRFLCLGDTEKEVVFTLASPELMPAIIEALRTAPDLCRKAPGIGFLIDVTDFLRSGSGQECQLSGAAPMATTHQLICVIANSGFAYDIMHVARKAGARGGTLLKARGTANENDSSFFGITIVPEKDVILILARNEAVAHILEAVRSCDFLSEPGTGIIFCVPASDFFLLGQAQTPLEG
ncbi:MAG: P-II family nitrogen regulator [Desulfovibrio sp.]|nr:P-II family nitrogen regulator [Desulfovibrio sp.]